MVEPPGAEECGGVEELGEEEEEEQAREDGQGGCKHGGFEQATIKFCKRSQSSRSEEGNWQSNQCVM